MKDGEDGEVGSFIFGITLGCLIGVVIMYIPVYRVEQFYKIETIKRGYAEYNQNTGEWQWKNSTPVGE